MLKDMLGYDVPNISNNINKYNLCYDVQDGLIRRDTNSRCQLGYYKRNTLLIFIFYFMSTLYKIYFYL